MPNPYRYTPEELEDLVKQWHNDNFVVETMKEFIMYETRFDSEEYDHWERTGEVPNDYAKS